MTPRLGLIGAGRWGKVYIRTILALGDRCVLTHLCTSRPENASLIPHEVQVMGDWRQLVRSDCDAVIIATPPQTHAEMVEACLELGRPCLVEKPLCLDVPAAERLHQRVRASGVPVLVDHTFLFHAAYQALKSAVSDAGETIRVIHSEGMSWGPFRTHTPVLWDWCPHDVSMCLDLMGDVPEHVEALGGPRTPDGTPEMVSVRLDFSGGRCAWIHAGRIAASKRRRLVVITESHVYAFDDLAPEPLTVSDIDFPKRYENGAGAAPERRAITVAGEPLPMARLLTYFLDGLAGGDRRYFGTQLALEVTRVLASSEVSLMEAVNPVPRAEVRGVRGSSAVVPGER